MSAIVNDSFAVRFFTGSTVNTNIAVNDDIIQSHKTLPQLLSLTRVFLSTDSALFEDSCMQFALALENSHVSVAK